MFTNIALLVILLVDALVLFREYTNRRVHKNKYVIILSVISIVAILIVFLLKLFGLS